jgi:hypothetical protein
MLAPEAIPVLPCTLQPAFCLRSFENLKARFGRVTGKPEVNRPNLQPRGPEVGFEEICPDITHFAEIKL